MSRKIFFTVGPTQLYPTVPSHIRTALRESILSISHRGKQFLDIYKNTTDNLRAVLGIPPDYFIFFLASATEAMERVIQNTVQHHSFHFINGAFSKRFYTTAVQLGKNANKTEIPHGSSFDVKSLVIPQETECICVTQNETATGVTFPIEDICYLKQKHKDKLVALDIVSSAPFTKIDFPTADLTFFSVQKGFGLPAGLGVLIVGPKAFAKSKNLHKKGIITGSYHNFLSLEEYARKDQLPETPNVLDIYLLGKVCGDFLDKGMDIIRRETEDKAAAFYDYFDSHPKYKPAVREERFRSKTTIVIDTPGETAKIITYLAKNGFIISSGYGLFKENQIRLANFPSHSIEDAKRLINIVKYMHV